MAIFHCYVSLPEGNGIATINHRISIGFHDPFMAIYPLVSSSMTGKSGETYGEECVYGKYL